MGKCLRLYWSAAALLERRGEATVRGLKASFGGGSVEAELLHEDGSLDRACC
jgi:hypothetical protein